jgi:hypothetical protein
MEATGFCRNVGFCFPICVVSQHRSIALQNISVFEMHPFVVTNMTGQTCKKKKKTGCIYEILQI